MLLSSVEEGMLWPKSIAGVVRLARIPTTPPGFHHVKASQAFTPSLSKEGSFVPYLCRGV